MSEEDVEALELLAIELQLNASTSLTWAPEPVVYELAADAADFTRHIARTLSVSGPADLCREAFGRKRPSDYVGGIGA